MRETQGHLQLRPGDILLTRSRSIGGWLNTTIQRLVKSRSIPKSIKNQGFIPSHVALVITGNRIIHSVKALERREGVRPPIFLDFLRLLSGVAKKGWWATLRNLDNEGERLAARFLFGHGVDTDKLTSLLDGKTPNDVRLVRHPDLEGDWDEMADRWAMVSHRALYHLDQTYNPFFTVADGENASVFCSQLVYKVFSDIGVELPEADSRSVFPIHFLVWAYEGEWAVYDGSEVLAAISKMAERAKDREIEGVYVENHRAIVRYLQKSNKLLEAFDNFDRVTANIVRSTNGRLLPPRNFRRLGISPFGITVEGLVLAANDIHQHLIGNDKSSTELGGEGSQDELFAGLSPSMTELAKKPMGWQLETRRVRDLDESNSDDARFIVTSNLMDQSEAILDDWELAVCVAIDWLQDDGHRRDDDSEAQANDADQLPEPIADLVYVSQWFDVSTDAPDLQELEEVIFRRYTNDLDQVDELVRSVREIVGQSASEITQGSGDRSVQIKELATDTWKHIVSAHQYARVKDFLDVSLMLRQFSVESSSGETISNCFRIKPDLLLEVCIIFRDMTKMSDFSGSMLDTLIPMFKRDRESIDPRIPFESQSE